MRDEEVYRKHADGLVRFATGLVGPFDAPDVVTDACLNAFRSRNWSSVSNHRAYLYRAVLNEARSHHRTTLRRRAREQRAAAPASLPAEEPDVDVLEAVAALSVRQRAAIVLTYWDDLGVAEVASLLGLSEGSVKRHLARGRARLRELLDG